MNIKEKEKILLGLGFEKIQNVEEIIKYEFIIDSIQIEKDKIILYPITTKAKYIRNLTHLTNTYWKYILDLNNLKEIKEMKPSKFEKIIETAKIAESSYKSVIFGFHNNGLLRTPTIWFAKENTIADKITKEIYKPRYIEDLRIYNKLRNT